MAKKSSISTLQYNLTSISYDGNRITSVNDASDDETTGLAPRFFSGIYSDAMAYDANGNITRDDTRAISSVTYHPFLNLPKRVTFADGSYLAWDYRPDGRKTQSTSAEKYIRVTTTVNSKGDTIVRQQTRYNTDLRKYIGAFEISGSTWRVYHDAGHTDIASSGALTHRYYVRDYLGSTRAVIDEEGNVLQSTAYYPSGVPLTSNDLAPQTIKLHTGKDFFDLQGAGWYDNQARYYDCLLGRFTSQDPLAEKYPGLNPYNHCANNPLRFVDKDGRDIWEIDERGEIKCHITTKDNDQFYMVDNNGNRIKNKFIIFENIVIERSSTQKTNTSKLYDVYRIRGDKNATKLFEFFSQNTEVEWSKFALGVSGKYGLNYITTGHSTNSEPAGADLFYKQLRYNYTLRSHIHNHPNNTPYPSGLDTRTNGDIGFSKYVETHSKQNPIFQIYIPKLDLYIDYNSNSTWENFKSKK